MVLNALREVLTAKISADFGPYFAFIESLPQVDEGHRHHILPRKEFPEFIKNPSNLIRLSPANHFRAHYWLAVCAPQCESFQVAFYLMANCRSNQITIDDLPRYVEIYEQGRIRQLEIARIIGQRAKESGQTAELGRTYGKMNGQVQGKKNVENGHLAKVRTSEVCIKGGQRNAESGQIQALGRSGIGGRIRGREAAKSGQIQKLGHVQGRKNVENGHLARVRTHEGSVKGGQIGGRKVVENGHLASIQTPENRAKGLHTRWHVKRNIVNPNCQLCATLKT